VTALFPADEPLAKKLRENAVEILAGGFDFLIAGKNRNAAAALKIKIAMMQEYLCSARESLAGVNPLNFTILEREYGILAGFFDMEEEAYDARGAKEEQSIKDRGDRGPKKQEATAVAVPSAQLTGRSEGASERQTAILAYLNQARQAKIGDFSPLFTAVSLKTIQRDLQDLVAKNILRKEGERRWTVYVRNDVL
jgi:hypothetical protein